jgi:hypothetical protein
MDELAPVVGDALEAAGFEEAVDAVDDVLGRQRELRSQVLEQHHLPRLDVIHEHLQLVLVLFACLIFFPHTGFLYCEVLLPLIVLFLLLAFLFLLPFLFLLLPLLLLQPLPLRALLLALLLRRSTLLLSLPLLPQGFALPLALVLFL